MLRFIRKLTRRYLSGRREVRRLRALLDNDFDLAVVIRKIQLGGNEPWVAEFEGKVFPLLASQLFAWFNLKNGINFLEMSASVDPVRAQMEVGEFIITLQLRNGETPWQLMREAQQNAKMLEKKVEDLEAALKIIRW